MDVCRSLSSAKLWLVQVGEVVIRNLNLLAKAQKLYIKYT